jgi:glycosyltransferase involved in cell wall biosynthesis
LNGPGNDCHDAIENYPDGEICELACVGRLRVSEKGQHLLLASLAQEQWTARPYRLSIYGAGPDHKYLEELVAFYGLSDKVRLAGHTSDILGIWERAHLAIQPSFTEGAPQSLIEAMLCRRACVATGVGGIPDWVEDGRSGFLAPAATLTHLSVALERAWENRHRWKEMGEDARQACLAKRDPDPAGTLLALVGQAEATESHGGSVFQ